MSSPRSGAAFPASAGGASCLLASAFASPAGPIPNSQSFDRPPVTGESHLAEIVNQTTTFGRAESDTAAIGTSPQPAEGFDRP